MLEIRYVSEDNIDDLLNVCSGGRLFAPADDPTLMQGREIRKQWLLHMRENYGNCAKVAYLDGRPVAQILYYPEESMLHVEEPRKNVVFLKCIFNPVTDAQRKGVCDALMKSLLYDCQQGLGCLGGGKCDFLVTQTFPHEGALPLADFYRKYGFREADGEMYREIDGEYRPRNAPRFRALSGDRGRVTITYNPECEWGYYFAMTAGGLLRERNPGLQVVVINNGENPEVYRSRPYLPLIAASTIANGKLMDSFLFWVDREACLRNIEEALRE